MIRGLVSTLEKHHNVRILDQAVSEAVRLSARYIPSRQLPDKAVSLIDTEVGILDREMAAGEKHGYRRDALLAERAEKSEQLEALRTRWEKEKELAADIGAIRTKIEDPANTEDKDGLRDKLAGVTHDLHDLQGEEPLIYPVVDGQAVAEIVAGWTGIPTGRMQSNEIRTVLN